MDNLSLEEKLIEIEKKIDGLLLKDNEEKIMKENKIMDLNGRITIPKTIRKMLGIDNSAEMEIYLLEDKIILKKVK